MALVSGVDLDHVIHQLAADPRLVHLERIPARPARYGELALPLPDAVASRLPIDRFWSHQAAAIDLARAGHSVVVATGTASGKSLCYQVPIAEASVQPVRPASALLVFPTKALAQDQLRSLAALDVPHLTPATYDGDTEAADRTWVRAHANVVLTNPEMLHHGLLPHHERWATFLMRLQYVVVDELHVLRGVFGTHVAHLLRRLRRLCAHYGSSPTFIFSSATLGRPGRLARDLCGLDVTEVTDDGSPHGERLFALWNPAAGDPSRPGTALRPSANRETARVMAELVQGGHRTIAFCRSRKGTELVAADVRRRLPDELAERVRPYRGGYLASERREIEHELFGGALRGVVATTALELGVDVGGLDACVLDGFPGTIASMWQQAGRAGRGGDASVVVLVAGEDQLDQWLVHHPDEVFSRPPEPAVINPANPFVLNAHLGCAAYERPLGRTDERWWPGLLDDGVRDLVVGDRLKVRVKGRGGGAHPLAVWAGRGWPSHEVGLRSSSSREIRIVLDDATLVGTVDRGRACRLVHPGAVYLHQGQSYRVAQLDLDDGAAIVERCDGGEWTQPRSTTDITILADEQHRSVGRSRLSLGRVEVRSQVVGYRRFDTTTGELLGTEELFLPPSELVTRAFWYTVDPRLLAAAGIAPARVPGTLHAIEHAAIGLLPLFTICDRWDVGGVSTPLQAETGLPTVVVYDGYPGGAGIAELGYASADRHLAATLEVIASCRCDTGCPSCVQSPKCGNGNEPLDKPGAVDLLEALLAA
ncbi:MAG TPA: DEAD/DEAH box helicase [Acidimicrobiales bacterium]|nr:DEAD/DEAH box helicase [Acidimicrobiales bacterium]